MNAASGLATETRIPRLTTAEQVAGQLEQRILSGELRSGTPLREVALAEAYDVSRSTMREALKLLEGERVVSHRRHRGFFVASLDADDIADVYDVRLMLELAAADRCESAPESALAAVEAAHESLVAAVQIGERIPVVDADLELHSAIVGLSGSRRASAFFSAIVAEIRFGVAIIAIADNELEQHDVLLEQHAQIVQALSSRDRPLARRLLADHIEANRARLIEILRSGESG